VGQFPYSYPYSILRTEVHPTLLWGQDQPQMDEPMSFRRSRTLQDVIMRKIAGEHETEGCRPRPHRRS
jgi:hypothetical protein